MRCGFGFGFGFGFGLGKGLRIARAMNAGSRNA